LVITNNATGLKGSGAITYGLINYANTGISLDSGPISASPEPSNFRLTVANTTIANASKDGINSLDTPFSVDSSTVQNAGANGIIGSFFSPANCSSTIPTVSPCVRLNVTSAQITGPGKDGIIANGLSGQPTVISGNTITDAGTYGIRLVGADQLTLTSNHVRKSAPPTAAALRYPAIYLISVKADFEVSAGAGVIIQGNGGKWNGLDAIVFHGEATKKLTWITAVAAPSGPLPVADVTFGYLLDGPLAVDGDLVTNGDIVKTMNGGIKINGGSLQSVGTTFTSLKDNPGLPACHSVFIPDACPTLPATLATNSDWNGINIDASNSVFKKGRLLYATAGLNITNAKLDVSGATFYKLNGTALSSSGLQPLTVTCSSIRGNGTGVAADTGTVSQSDVYNNSVADLSGNANLHADSDWLTAAPKITGPVTVTGALAVQRPVATLSLAGDNQLANDQFGNKAFGIGHITLTADMNRQANTSVVPLVEFTPSPGPPTTLTGLLNNGWTTVQQWSPNPYSLDLAHTSAGVDSLKVSGARGCVPPEIDDPVANLNNPDSNLVTPTSKTFSASILPTTLVASPATGVYGGKATLVAHLTANGLDAANQTISFKLKGSAAGTATTGANGNATLLASLGTINAGSYTGGFQASYAGDPNLFYTPAPAALGTPITATLTVTQAPTATTQAATTASSTVYGQSITLSASVTTTVAGGIDPGAADGAVAFTEGATTICSAPLGTGTTTAACTLKTVPVGVHAITAVFTATLAGNFQSSSAASTLSQTVSIAPTTTSTATSDGNPSIYGQPITLGATVTSPNLDPGLGEGSVVFKEGVTPICSAPLGANNKAACTVNTLTAATHAITAMYTASGGNFQDSTAGATLSQVVNPASVTVAASASPEPSVLNATVTLSATVTTTVAGGINPNNEGTVTFSEGATFCTTPVLTGNSGSCTFSGFSAGPHTVKATYNPSANFLTGSQSFPHQVN
jgi:hypothetical protein